MVLAWDKQQNLSRETCQGKLVDRTHEKVSFSRKSCTSVRGLRLSHWTKALDKREWELMKVKKQEFAWEFSQLSCPGQARGRVARELHESWLDISAQWQKLLPTPIKIILNQFKVNQSWWDRTGVDESWWTNVSESCNSRQLSFLFDRSLNSLIHW